MLPPQSREQRMDKRTLDEQRREFSNRPLIATPIAGMFAWGIAGIAGYILPTRGAALVLFIATGLIAYLAMGISRFTGENFMDRSRPMNGFDALFLYTAGMSLLGYAIAIPFFLVDRTSLPLTVGVLTGLMWVPISWIIQHWIGIAHAVVRTGAVVTAWYLWPAHRFVIIPAVIVVLYALAIVVLLNRPRVTTIPTAPASSSSC
jgi:hypothetical protein